MEANVSQIYHEEFFTDKGRVVVWKSADYSLDKNSAYTKRKIEQQEIIQMLNVLGYPVTHLHYKDSGQPLLAHNSSEYLSVSHAQGWFALYVAKEPVGIDIEVERATLVKGKSWFINPAELPRYLTLDALHLVWGAKEAYYKKCEGQIKDLKMDVTVVKIGTEALTISHQGQEIQLFYKAIQNTYLVWT